MALARFNGLAQDEAGNVVPSALVQVRRQESGALVPVYADIDGEEPLGSTFSADTNGKFTFCVTDGFYRIRVYKAIGGALYEQIWEDVGISRAQGGEVTLFQPAAEWLIGETYAQGALVSHPDSGSVLRLFISRIPNNLGNTPPNSPSSNAQWMYAGTAVTVAAPPIDPGDTITELDAFSFDPEIHLYAMVRLDVATEAEVKLPNDAEQGAGFMLTQIGLGRASFVAEAGGSVNSDTGFTKTFARRSVAVAFVEENSDGSSASWILGGALGA